MKRILFCLLILLSLSACKKEAKWIWMEGGDGDPIPDTFSFVQDTAIVSVGPSTTAYTIEGKLDEGREKEFDEWINLIFERTNAVKGKHYDVPDKMILHFDKGATTASLQITLYPQNIDKQMQIAFTTAGKYGSKDYTKYIDTLVVKLVPAQ